MIIYLKSQNPDDKEIGYSNVLVEGCPLDTIKSVACMKESLLSRSIEMASWAGQNRGIEYFCRTLLIHGIETDWIEEEMADDDDFRYFL